MNRVTLISILFSVFLFSNVVNAQVIKGNGKLKTDIRDLGSYNKIIAQGKFNLILTQGEKEAIKIETDENIIDLFQTRLDNKTLYLTMAANIRKSEGLNIYVSIKDLSEIILLSDIVLKSESVIHFDDLKIFSAGMSQINLELFASKLTLELSDGTYAFFKGYAEYIDAHIHDETELNAFELQTDFAKVLSTGLTEVMVYVEKELELTITGASNLYYSGNPTITQRIFSSTGFIVKRQRSN